MVKKSPETQLGERNLEGYGCGGWWGGEGTKEPMGMCPSCFQVYTLKWVSMYFNFLFYCLYMVIVVEWNELWLSKRRLDYIYLPKHRYNSFFYLITQPPGWGWRQLVSTTVFPRSTTTWVKSEWSEINLRKPSSTFLAYHVSYLLEC